MLQSQLTLHPFHQTERLFKSLPRQVDSMLFGPAPVSSCIGSRDLVHDRHDAVPDSVRQQAACSHTDHRRSWRRKRVERGTSAGLPTAPLETLMPVILKLVCVY